MNIKYVHASEYGNGAMVAEEFKKQIEAHGVKVNVHHIGAMSPKELPPADLKWQRVIPIMNEILQEKGLVKIAEDKILVTDIKGPLEEGWQKKVEAFVARIPLPA